MHFLMHKYKPAYRLGSSFCANDISIGSFVAYKASSLKIMNGPWPTGIATWISLFVSICIFLNSTFQPSGKTENKGHGGALNSFFVLVWSFEILVLLFCWACKYPTIVYKLILDIHLVSDIIIKTGEWVTTKFRCL